MQQTIGTPDKKFVPRVGVADDDESMREALESLLKSVGFRTAIYASAQEFLNAGECSSLDCLVLDVRMPDMDGLELQQKLIELNNPIPIVFISAHSEKSEKERAIASGAIDFLEKPFSEDSLLGAIEAAIRSKRVET
jgi:two-component system response regulator FixJ